MNKTLMTLFAILATTATAQQTVKATFAPVTLDGVTTQNGMITVNGKNYVSVDALKGSGVNLLKTNSLGIYRYPNAQGQPIKLQGCMNEWLYNGVDRLRVDSVRWNKSDSFFEINTTLQTPTDSASVQHFESLGSIVTWANSRITQPGKNPLQKMIYTNGFLHTGVNNAMQIFVKDPDAVETDTITKIVVAPGGGYAKNVMTFDLTCKK